MEVYSSEGLSGSPELKNLAGLLEDWKRQGPRKGLEFADFEQQVRLAVMALERRTIREGLQALDVAVDEIKVADEVLCRAYGKPFEAAYVCLAGEIRVSRHLYRRADGMGKALCPLELRAGIVESSWTPQAAERICQTVAVMTPYEAEVVIAGFGGMKPSRSSLDRIPEQVSARWEARREEFERGVRQQETVPQEVETVAVSLDGVMAPLREEEAPERPGGKKRRRVAYHEASCGTVSLHDAEGARLETIFCGRMPESKKPTLQRQLEAETADILVTMGVPRLAFVADGAAENWRIADEITASLKDAGHLGSDTPVFRIVDFWHASQHLKDALDAAYAGHGPPTAARAEHERLKVWLRDEDGGVDSVLRELKRLRRGCCGERRKKLTSEIGYFEKRREQMDYARFLDLNLPIGSGVVEAACKTLVTQRLKRSGMSWSREGGQAVLTLRALLLSARWCAAWKLISGSYCGEVYGIRTKGHLTCIEPLEKAA